MTSTSLLATFDRRQRIAGRDIFPLPEAVLMPQTALKRPDAICVGLRAPARRRHCRRPRACASLRFAIERDVEIVVLSETDYSGFERFGFRIERIAGRQRRGPRRLRGPDPPASGTSTWCSERSRRVANARRHAFTTLAASDAAALAGVSRVEHQRAAGDQSGIVDLVVIRHDERGVVSRGRRRRPWDARAPPSRACSCVSGTSGDEWVVIVDDAPLHLRADSISAVPGLSRTSSILRL